jgi:hypothetical protein
LFATVVVGGVFFEVHGVVGFTHDKKIDRLTHFASTLLSAHGELEIYDQTYEDIIKTLKSGSVGGTQSRRTAPSDLSVLMMSS